MYNYYSACARPPLKLSGEKKRKMVKSSYEISMQYFYSKCMLSLGRNRNIFHHKMKSFQIWQLFTVFVFGFCFFFLPLPTIMFGFFWLWVSQHKVNIFSSWGHLLFSPSCWCIYLKSQLRRHLDLLLCHEIATWSSSNLSKKKRSLMISNVASACEISS